MKSLIIVVFTFSLGTLFAQGTSTTPEMPTVTQEDIGYDTITMDQSSVAAVKVLMGEVSKLQKLIQLTQAAEVSIMDKEIEKKFNELSGPIMLIASYYVDPKKITGFTEDHKIIAKK